MARFDEGAVFAGEFLEHFGVKGMKWGRRKGSGSDSSSSSSKSDKEDISEDASEARRISAKVKTGGTQALSNKELRTLVDRMGLEKRFSEINTPAAKKKNPILQGVTWTGKKMGSLTGQAMEQVIKANIATEMNNQLKTAIAQKRAGAAA